MFAIVLLTSCKEENIYVTALDVEQRDITMMVGQEITLRVDKFYPKEPKEYELRWRSNAASFLIDMDSISGKVIAMAPGEAIVQVFINNEPKSSCNIHIEGVIDVNNDVYICGSSNNKPVYWINGFVKTLNSTKNYTQITANSIDVYNGDVYVLGAGWGYDKGARFDEITCWKNGEQIFSSENGSTLPAGLFVHNNNYYILGMIRDPFVQKTTIWKNGVRTDFLLENGTRAHSIFVSNNDVYVAGETTYDLKQINETTYRDCTIAKYWKNGQEICLTDSNSVAGAWDIAVKGQDVYVVGWKLENEIRTAKYWKSGEEFNLNEIAEWSDAHSIAINDDNVYILGIQKGVEHYVPVLWKNGIKTTIDDEGFYYQPNKISVCENGDVYIATKNNNDFGNYFKNGKRVHFAKLYPDYPTISDIRVVLKSKYL
jgi:hypothetical protein